MLEQSRLILISGGARSGKSRFAHQLALSLGSNRLFVATAQAWDQEMKARISAHQDERGADFDTLEEPLDLEKAFETQSFRDVILIDCLTLWISNYLLDDRFSDEEIKAKIQDSLSAALQRAGTVILVSNEVGFGIVPDNALARRFRDLNGSLQQAIAARANEVYLSVLGQTLPLHKLRFEAMGAP